MTKLDGITTGKILLLAGAVALWIGGVFLIQQGGPPRQKGPGSTPTPQPTAIPTEKPTPFWQRYESESLNIELNYPQNWFLNETNNLIQLTNYNPEEAPGRGYIPGQDGDLFKVEIFVDNEFSDVDNWLENKLNQTDPITGEPTEINNKKELTVDDQRAVFYENESPMSGLTVGSIHIEATDNGILHIYGQLNYPDHKEDIKKIYDSVEFTNTD